jgi:hypothetical protein
MKNKDQILLEKLYDSVIHEQYLDYGIFGKKMQSKAEKKNVENMSPDAAKQWKVYACTEMGNFVIEQEKQNGWSEEKIKPVLLMLMKFMELLVNNKPLPYNLDSIPLSKFPNTLFSYVSKMLFGG